MNHHTNQYHYEVKIVNNGWPNKHVKSVSMNYTNSTNYKYFTDNIQPIIEQEFETLVDLNIKIIETVCNNYFKIDTKIVRQTDLGVSGKGSKLILEICKC